MEGDSRHGDMSLIIMPIAPSQGQLTKKILFSRELGVLKQICTVKRNFLYFKPANNYVNTVCDALL
jgi:hypothetical protein